MGLFIGPSFLHGHRRMPDSLIERVKKTIKAYDMLQAGDKVIVAVSGGPDSVCLLDVLHCMQDEFQITLVIAHFDHGLRPGEDQNETEFVRQLANSYGLEFYTARASSDLVHRGGSLEERAREERYQFLEGVQRKVHAHKIAIGHQLDDQAETVLLRLLRGSGTQGLGAIPPVRDGIIIRPLIGISRKEISAYLVQKGLKWMEDSSNLSTVFMRNRIRRELVPLLKTYQPRILEILAKTAEIIRADESYLNMEAEQWLEAHGSQAQGHHISIPISRFSTLPEALQRRVLRRAIKRVRSSLCRISWAHIELAQGLVSSKKPQGEIHLPGNLAVKKRYDRFIISPRDTSGPNGYSYTIPGKGAYELKAIESTIEISEFVSPTIEHFGHSPWIALLDRGKIDFPLTVRPYRPGDRFAPLGMKGTKKVHDLFVDKKIPLELRKRIPIVCSGQAIIWVGGLRVDERFKITKATHKILRLKVSGRIVEELEANLGAPQRLRQ